MPDTTCRRCNSDAAFAEIHGVFTTGFYGSRRHDTASFIWIDESRAGLEEGDLLCDDCIDYLVSDGQMKFVRDMLSEAPAKPLGVEANRRIFLDAATRMHDILRNAIGQHAAPAGEKPAMPDIADIVAIRAVLTDDPTRQDRCVALHSDLCPDNVARVGRAHAQAVFMLAPAPGPDPDYAAAAQIFAQDMQRMYDLFEQMYATLEGDIADITVPT